MSFFRVRKTLIFHLLLGAIFLVHSPCLWAQGSEEPPRPTQGIIEADEKRYNENNPSDSGGSIPWLQGTASPIQNTSGQANLGLEGVFCDEPDSGGSRNCTLQNLLVQSIVSGYENSAPKSFIEINGRRVKIGFSCEPNICLLANPTLSNCATLAAQSKTSGRPMSIRLRLKSIIEQGDIVNPNKTESRIQELKNGEYVYFVLGEEMVSRLYCTMP